MGEGEERSPLTPVVHVGNSGWPPFLAPSCVSQVRTLKKGSECGIIIRDYSNLQPGDMLSFYEVVMRRPLLYDDEDDVNEGGDTGAAGRQMDGLPQSTKAAKAVPYTT